MILPADFFREPRPALDAPSWFNYQGAYPGGATERKRLADCEALLAFLAHDWQSTSHIARELGWTHRRTREAIKAVRGEIEYRRVIGESGAEECQWRVS